MLKRIIVVNKSCTTLCIVICCYAIYLAVEWSIAKWAKTITVMTVM